MTLAAAENSEATARQSCWLQNRRLLPSPK